MEMNAAVLRDVGRPEPYDVSEPLSVERVTLDDPGPGEVLVQVAAAGLCHSDLSAIQGVRRRSLPVVAGHEGSGIVAAIGPGVADLAPGDHVVMVFVSACRVCPVCVGGEPQLCRASWTARSTGTLLSGEKRLSVDGRPLNHWSGISSFAEYCVVSTQSLVKIDPAIPLDVASSIGCAVLTGAGAVINAARPRPGDSVVVLGSGGVGLSAVMAAAAIGASPVIAVDVQDHKLELAMSVGATHCVNARESSVVASVHAITDGGARYAFDMAGTPRSAQEGFEMLRPGGALVCVALPPDGTDLELPVSRLVSEGKRVVGSYMGDSDPARDVAMLSRLYLDGRLPIDRLQSARLPLQRINHGFDRLRTGAAIRDVVVMPGFERLSSEHG